jgi:hypothetical protein
MNVYLNFSILIQFEAKQLNNERSIYDDDHDDVYLEYYSEKGFHINYSCLHVLRKTYKLVQ